MQSGGSGLGFKAKFLVIRSDYQDDESGNPLKNLVTQNVHSFL